VAVCLLCVAGHTAWADTWFTPAGATIGGRPVDASAAITFTAAGGIDTYFLVLTNLEANPTNINQNLSDVTITFGSNNMPAPFSDQHATERTVNAAGMFTIGPTVFPNRAGSETQNTITL
jgi:hypothetical protein